MGLVLGVLWLALPQLERSSRWLYRVAIIIALAVAVFSRYAVILVPLLVAMLFLKPWGQSKRGERARGSHQDTETNEATTSER